ncbi:MAG: lytic transglycosylase domain-containing protein [Acidobacteriota bacterium]
MPVRLFRSLVSAAIALALSSRALRAELVVFEDGRVVKVASYEVRGDELEIGLPGGGGYSVAMSRVERIVDDEVLATAAEVREASPAPAAAAVLYDLGYQSHRKPLFGSPYDGMIDAAARRYDVDAALVSALIRAESNYEPRAVSRKGARGLMQLMPATARRLDVRRPFDPASNVRGGVRYLRELLDRFDSRPELVLAAYNAGEGAVESYQGVPPYRETVGYVKRILSWWKPAVASAVASSAPASPSVR